ncbi:hypothetical protein [Saccharibacillus sp. JS10]|uniref:spr1630 family ClpXP-sensitive toxin n=1 Tax=Saccharibacillus sp. JS10 TaxID=2950552 RepID=UPI00210EC515|nr:hypothetical protein [Saccharibacillus sp. JS10]MCQ4087868.1 hypothetical protein [Saccharibacillus sp. JS10]
MDQYRFSPQQSQMIVDAIVEGYREYIEHRKDRKAVMKISSAFAWTKGNFIESRIAEEAANHGFTYKKSKAGLTWDYLQFVHQGSKILFLVKNANYFNENAFSLATIPGEHKTSGKKRTYLHELSKINDSLEFPVVPPSKNGKERVEQLSLFLAEEKVKEELESFKSSYQEFHILTYKLDEAYQVAEIVHYLPNSKNNIAYLVEDLSDLISGADLTAEDLEVFAVDSDEEIVDPAAFDIGILEDEKTGE